MDDTAYSKRGRSSTINSHHPDDVHHSTGDGDETVWTTQQVYDTPTTTAQNAINVASGHKVKPGRVRFNSNANTTQSSHTPPPHQSTPPTRIEPARTSTPPATSRPSILRTSSAHSVTTLDGAGQVQSPRAHEAEAAAQARAYQLAARAHSGEFPDSSRASFVESLASSAQSYSTTDNTESIPLQNLSAVSDTREISSSAQQHPSFTDRARKLVERHFRRSPSPPSHADHRKTSHEHIEQAQAQSDEALDGSADGVYFRPPPRHYRGGVLSEMLKLHKEPKLGLLDNPSTVSLPGSSRRQSDSAAHTPGRRKWYEQNRSQETLVNLIEASARLANFQQGNSEQPTSPKAPKKHHRASSRSRLSALWQKEEARITVHIADTLARQDFILKLCHALMSYGAPTHRLEEYLTTVANALEIDGKFLYMPGCMLVSFGDATTHTTEVHLVRLAQGINLGKLKEVHRIYKEVMHDVISADEASEQLEELKHRKDQFHRWVRVLVFGLTSVAASPFSFKARLIDLPLLFLFGCIVGLLQLIVAAKSPLYSNVFEVSATILVSFLARAFGSLRGGHLFCFSALAQGGIVMLLPGYMFLSSSLELQSRAIIPGSLRIVYGIIYSLLLGFGITVGAAVYGLIDSNATRATTCEAPLHPYYGLVFVPFFVVCIAILYQAKWKQMPIMVIIAFAGYIVNYFSSIRFVASPQIASALGALAVGVMANLYSRVRHSVAAAVLIPAIFTQVPGGLASTGGLLSGLQTADLISNYKNGTAAASDQTGPLNNIVFNMGASMIQIAIGITVGLFMSALIVYPLGKRRSGLFSF